MSRRKLDLKLNLSPPRVNRQEDSPSRSGTTSPQSSCVSSETNQKQRYSEEEEATSSMVLVGCPRCLMYVMLAEEDPRCPKCKSTVLLDVMLPENSVSNNKTTAAAASRKRS